MPCLENSNSCEFDEFVRGISFQYINPYFKMPYLFWKGYNLFERHFNFSFESINTRFLNDDLIIKRELHALIKIPKMSTLAIGAIINFGVKCLPEDQAFVNVGVWNGFTFLAGMQNNPDKTCVGVDNFSEFGGPRKHFLERFDKIKSPFHYFYDMDYEEYFSKIHKGSIGLYIYDGEHSV